MTAPVFIANADWADEFTSDPTTAEGLLPVAEAVADVAAGSAPERLGHYKRSFHTVAGVAENGKATARVYNDDFKAHWIEAGSGEPIPTPALHILGRAAEQVVGPLGSK